MTVQNIRAYLAAKAAGLLLLLLLAHSAFGGAALVSCTVPPFVSKLRLLVATNQLALGLVVTNNYNVAISSLSQTVTNLITNLVSGTNMISAQVVGTNGISSDVTPSIPAVCPVIPDGLQTVPMSLVVPIGTPIQVSRDFVDWRERISVSEEPVILSAGISTPPPMMVRVTYRMIPDFHALFFRPQPLPLQPPSP